MKKQDIDFSNIEKSIVTVIEQKVLIDSDVANIYGVLTKEVNQAVMKFKHTIKKEKKNGAIQSSVISLLEINELRTEFSVSTKRAD